MPNQTGKFVSCFHDGFSKMKKKVKSRSGDYFLCGFSDGEKKQRNTEVPPNKPSNVENKYFFPNSLNYPTLHIKTKI